MVGTSGLIFHCDHHGLGIADLARGGFVFHRRKATEGKGDAIEHLRADRVEVFIGIGFVGTVYCLVFLKSHWAVIRDGARPLRRDEVILAFQFHKVAQNHMDGGGFCVGRQHQANVLPRQGRLAHNSIGQAAFEADLLIAVSFSDGRLAEMIGLFNGLGLCIHRGSQ